MAIKKPGKAVIKWDEELAKQEQARAEQLQQEAGH